MVSPFNGWTSVNSFLDHDSPDYTLDGTIVIANGLQANSSAGQASDFFPSYWSSSLRQYISYDGHNGYDFGLSYQPILAAADGTVTFADWNSSSPYAGYGQMVLIDHHNGYVTLYGHLSKVEVHAGQKVSAGQEIGISGSTGNSSGPHLHFSVFHNCQVTDPYGWTGDGTDPLASFNGERPGYLWLPAHDPLILNPPPRWPTFPLGLHISLPALQKSLRHVGRRVVPPIDRLLLLALPAPQGSERLSAPAALAVTEARISQETNALVPYLHDLRTQGLLDDFQLIPAAAAVWVRGTTSAGQLEGLPGVASLSGVQPRDLIAAQSELAHSVLIQLSAGHAPSLWPSGFRSSLQAWRPTTTVANGHALVTGFTLPGQTVAVSLHRGGSVHGVAEALADPETGGFVAMLHDMRGNPVSAAANDVVTTESAGRLSRVTILGCSLRARAYDVSGQAPANGSVAITLISQQGRMQWHGVVAASRTGAFSLRTKNVLVGGTQAIASFVNAAGDDESVTADVPGIIVAEKSATIRGWTVGSSPRLSVRRAGRTLFQSKIQSNADGSFQLSAMGKHGPLQLVPGDVIVVGSPWHHRRLVVPRLHAGLSSATARVHVGGQPGIRIHVTESGPGSQRWESGLSVPKSGIVQLPWRAGKPVPGDRVSVTYLFPSGDVAEARAQTQQIVVSMETPEISGRTAPATTLSFQISTRSGYRLGSAIATSDSATGAFRVALVNRAGHPIQVHGGQRLLIREEGRVRDVSIPSLGLHLTRKGAFWTGVALANKKASLFALDGTRRLRPVAEVLGSVHFSQAMPTGGTVAPQFLLTQSMGLGLTVQRSATAAATLTRAHNRPRKR